MKELNQKKNPVDGKRARKPPQKLGENEEIKGKRKGDTKKRKVDEIQNQEQYEMGCECEDPYDETRPMLDCGKCEQWFHHYVKGVRATDVWATVNRIMLCG